MFAIGDEPYPATDGPELSPDERAELDGCEPRRPSSRPRGGAGRRRHFSWRTPVSIVLIVLGCILGPVAVLGVWAGTEVSDTGRWVATVEPLIHDPAIQAVLTDKITKQITSQLNLTGTIDQASAQLNDKGLPRISSLLKTFGPQIASAVTGFIHSTVQRIISGPRVAKLWVQVNTVAHQAVVKVLSGEGNGAVSTRTARSCSTSARSSPWSAGPGRPRVLAGQQHPADQPDRGAVPGEGSRQGRPATG